jgi:hypothetical protein
MRVFIEVSVRACRCVGPSYKKRGKEHFEGKMLLVRNNVFGVLRQELVDGISGSESWISRRSSINLACVFRSSFETCVALVGLNL